MTAGYGLIAEYHIIWIKTNGLRIKLKVAFGKNFAREFIKLISLEKLQPVHGNLAGHTHLLQTHTTEFALYLEVVTERFHGLKGGDLKMNQVLKLGIPFGNFWPLETLEPPTPE
jgi:hypothetical protein